MIKNNLTNKNNKINKKQITYDIILIGLFTSVLIICSWITIPTLIPFTLQTLAICLITLLLGLKKGTIAIILYIILGLIGLPVFNSFRSGFSVILGPTGGYIIGFIPMLLVSRLLITIFGLNKQSKDISSDEKNNKKQIIKMLFSSLALLIGTIVCYIFGSIWFILVYGPDNANFSYVISVCIIPFIIPDIIKIIISVIVSNRLNKIIKQ